MSAVDSQESRFPEPVSDILLHVLITLAHIAPRASLGDEFDSLTRSYLQRMVTFARTGLDAHRTEDALFDWLMRQPGRVPPVTVLLDSRGRQMSSEAFAAWLGARRDDGAQHILFAIGPASGWSDAARARAQLLLSLGQLTLAHALARLVLAEQLYRATTILTGHPYHSGH